MRVARDQEDIRGGGMSEKKTKDARFCPLRYLLVEDYIRSQEYLLELQREELEQEESRKMWNQLGEEGEV